MANHRKQTMEEVLEDLLARTRRGEEIGVSELGMKTLEPVQARWAATAERQRLAINRLLGIIEDVREIAAAPALSPEQKLSQIKEIAR